MAGGSGLMCLRKSGIGRRGEPNLEKGLQRGMNSFSFRCSLAKLEFTELLYINHMHHHHRTNFDVICSLSTS